MGIVEESDHAKVPATMTPERLDLLLRRFHQNPAASDDSIRRAEKALGVAPGLLLVGSDGGGEAFAFDMRVSPSPVVSMPFVGMEPELAEVMAPTFDAFLEGLAV